MQDLTDTFVVALSRRATWDPVRVRNDVLPLITREGGSLQWGQSSGERWIRLLLAHAEPELYAILWRQAPLAIVVPHISVDLRRYLALQEVIVIEAEDWDTAAYSIDSKAVRAHGESDFWRLSESDSFESAFSIMDLWWATV